MKTTASDTKEEPKPNVECIEAGKVKLFYRRETGEARFFRSRADTPQKTSCFPVGNPTKILLHQDGVCVLLYGNGTIRSCRQVGRTVEMMTMPPDVPKCDDVDWKGFDGYHVELTIQLIVDGNIILELIPLLEKRHQIGWQRYNDLACCTLSS